VNPRSGTSYPVTTMTELLLSASTDLTEKSKDIKFTPSSCQYAGTHGYLRCGDTAVQYSVAIPVLINQLYIRFAIQLAMSLILNLKTHFELQPEDGFTNKPKHVPNMIF